jgi:Cdc6-like AAA superfamily ATPase
MSADCCSTEPRGAPVRSSSCLEQPDTSRRCFLEVGLKLAPNRLSGFERAIRRRLQNIVAARTNIELLRAIDDPAQVALVDVLRDIAGPSAAPAEMDASKKVAWESIASGKSINLVVGPPGVGKTYLISHLVKSILSQTPDARLLVSAQNHETLVQMEDELKKTLASGSIVVRVERLRSSEEVSSLRESSPRLRRICCETIESD